MLGVLGVSFQREHSFSTTDRLFLEALVDVAAPALAASLGRPTQQPPVTDLRAIVVRVASAATSFTHRIGAGSDGMPALTRAQAPPVTEVLDHLIANAVAPSLPGSAVDVRCAVVGPRIEVTVDDQGSGLPPERHRSVLEPSEGIERGLARRRRPVRAHAAQRPRRLNRQREHSARTFGSSRSGPESVGVTVATGDSPRSSRVPAGRLGTSKETPCIGWAHATGCSPR